MIPEEFPKAALLAGCPSRHMWELTIHGISWLYASMPAFILVAMLHNFQSQTQRQLQDNAYPR